MPGVAAAIGAFVTSVGTAVAGMGVIAQLGLRLLVSAAASALLQALAPKPRAPGIRTQVTQTGGTNPLSFILMTYATAGTRVCPPMSHGRSGDTPNAYLTEVIEVGDIPGQTLSRLIINDEYVTIGTTPHPDYGLPVLGDFDGFCWIKYYDGTQTAADPMLLAKYGSYPERPWSADMIGRGVCYAIITCKFKRKVWNAVPRFRFEVAGIPLYDPRKDTTVGGSGTHRWADKSTWQPSTNPMVAAYNIKRGIGLMDGSVWGGGYPAEDLPLASWFAAMNECDVLVNNGAGGTEAQYRAGFEVTVDDQPADVIAELLKACSGQLAEVGGLWKPRVGAPGLGVYSITDGDIVVSSAQDFDPFPGFTSSFNAVHASYPEPAQIWNPKEAPPLYNATWEDEDQGQRLVADLNLPAVPYGAQVRRLMEAYIAEERRFRRHGLTLPPDAAILEPLDAVTWTSAANAYTAKVFEVSQVTDNLMTGLQEVALRERDASDYVSSNPAPPEVVSPVPVAPDPQLVEGFAVAGVSIQDALGANRRPALELTWDAAEADLQGVMWEVRVQATSVLVATGTVSDADSGRAIVSEGILPSVAYEVRAQPVVEVPSAWTAWMAVTAPSTLLTRPDIADGAVSDQFQTIVLGPFTRADTPNGTVVATLNMGAIPPGTIWRRGIHFDARLTSTTADDYQIDLQRRYRQFGGAFGSWETTVSWTRVGALSGTDVWDQRTDSGGLAGSYDDFEYRLIVVTRPANGGSTYQWLRNIYLTTARVTK